MLRGSVKDSVKRLEDMKQATILRYLSNINLDKEYDLYDEMMAHFVDGTLNDYFTSPVLDNLAEDDMEDVCSLANEYMSLCFYAGSSEYWADSIDGVSIDDYELITLKIFDNYDFLLEVARDGGKEVLEQMKTFQDKAAYTESSVIDLLRNSFTDDKLLKDVLIEMGHEDSSYSVFTDIQKAELCKFPEGTLFTYDDGKAILRNPLELLENLITDFNEVNYSEEDIDYHSDNLSNLRKKVSKIPIESVIEYVSDEYVGEHGHYKDMDKITKNTGVMR